ncbi:triose-phosphate isomerase [Rhodoligotrophos defluvii]|uniref:triose-phosphate isomerase n=1 Tax=Rhodoligotrophos defluvii TaxID=2561934 RepID=UPI0010CA0CBA|nr:triose-phosphate isomerase [Rhodoligotrophos defluvii]
MAVNGPRPIIIGNWKMNGTSESLGEIRLMTGMLDGVELGCDVVVCPPATLIRQVHEMLSESKIGTGGQDCHPEPNGAFTGDISAEMLRDAGARYVILGHSERRHYHDESDALVRRKAEAAHRAGLVAIICVGETELERGAGDTLDVVSRQLAGSVPKGSGAENTIIAYEPVWAIGSGVTPTSDEIGEVHRAVRHWLAERLGDEAARAMRILYGGSVKSTNAADIFAIPDVDGSLVGQASLKAKDFLGIIGQFAPC